MPRLLSHHCRCLRRSSQAEARGCGGADHPRAGPPSRCAGAHPPMWRRLRKCSVVVAASVTARRRFEFRGSRGTLALSGRSPRSFDSAGAPPLIGCVFSWGCSAAVVVGSGPVPHQAPSVATLPVPPAAAAATRPGGSGSGSGSRARVPAPPCACAASGALGGASRGPAARGVCAGGRGCAGVGGCLRGSVQLGGRPQGALHEHSARRLAQPSCCWRHLIWRTLRRPSGRTRRRRSGCAEPRPVRGHLGGCVPCRAGGERGCLPRVHPPESPPWQRQRQLTTSSCCGASRSR
jgi:hypothetical protein